MSTAYSGQPAEGISQASFRTVCIVLWNTVYLGRALSPMARTGRTVDATLLPHIAPLGWQHINLTGDYLWSDAPSLDEDGYRRLRRFNTLETVPT